MTKKCKKKCRKVSKRQYFIVLVVLSEQTETVGVSPMRDIYSLQQNNKSFSRPCQAGCIFIRTIDMQLRAEDVPQKHAKKTQKSKLKCMSSVNIIQLQNVAN